MSEFPMAKADLGRLPVFTPDPALWSRIAQAHRQRRQARQLGFAIAATVLLGLGAAFLLQPAPAPEAGWVDVQRESQTLEAQWRQLVGNEHPAPIGIARLRSIDGALQAAYDRNAQVDEIVPLWQQRNAALRDLIVRVREAGARDSSLVTRI